MSPPPSGGPAFRRCRFSTETDPRLARRIHSQVCSMDASRRCYAAEAGKIALLQGFPRVGETGFEPATARPPVAPEAFCWGVIPAVMGVVGSSVRVGCSHI